ncbi:MAG TPA: pyridoxamine 5'-phosphate oxidase family protein [Nocardioidaceae bacterium]|nr:pyridoxamine 5'-phosphate oxidase family protein [Nocardioidaceae bacterium]
MADPYDPADVAKELIDSNRYMVLGTVDPDGRPRVSPVYYAPDGYSILYWISSPDSHHSRNLADRPEVGMVVFDSTAPIGAGRAVYLIATGERVPDDELDSCAAVACRARFPEQSPFPVEKLRPGASLRLYRARVAEHSIHIRGSDPDYGQGIDSRMVVTLS